MIENRGIYVPYTLVHRALTVLCIISTGALIFMSYDFAYRWSILLPVVYLISMHFFLRDYMLRGIGSIALVGMYAFRMCLLPVLCAYGNFYIEPDKSIYMQYFWTAILLMCLECIIVFGSLSYYSKRYNNRIEWFDRYNYTGINDSIFIVFSFVALLVYSIIMYTHPGFLMSHYHLLVSSVDESSLFEMDNAALQNYGASYYLAVVLDLTLDR